MTEFVSKEGNPRDCTECGQSRTEGPDPCLGYLPGLSHACCGHGDLGEAYACIGGQPNQSAHTIPNHGVLRGQHALDLFALLRKAKVYE